MKNLRKNHDFHKPVMVSEVIDFFETEKYARLNNPCLVDATVGLAGHAKEFVKRGFFVIGIDADNSSLKIAEEVLFEACPIPHRSDGGGSFRLLHGNFSKIDELIRSVYSGPVWGVIFDLGVSSFQLDNPDRGFSFSESESLLDMRFDRDKQVVKASDLLALLDKKKLKELFEFVLPANLSIKIADVVIKKRLEKPISTTEDFLQTIKPLVRRKGKINSATLPFLALRMAVNSEHESLSLGLNRAFKILEPEGRMAVISFHSGEDRIVKRYFKKLERLSLARSLTKKPFYPKDSEILKNHRARSAKMRVIEKI